MNKVREQWQDKHGGAENQHKIAVLQADQVSYQQLGLSQEDAQFIQQRELSTREVARIFRVPARIDTPILFPGDRGGHLNLNNWRNRVWYPALDAAGIARRGPYCLRHTFATEALAAGVSVFQLSRLMGTSVEMIERTYGHLARDSEDHLRGLLSSRSGDDVATAGEG